MHATSVERRSGSGKRKAPLAKRASVDDIAAYGVDMTDGEVIIVEYTCACVCISICWLFVFNIVSSYIFKVLICVISFLD